MRNRRKSTQSFQSLASAGGEPFDTSADTSADKKAAVVLSGRCPITPQNCIRKYLKKMEPKSVNPDAHKEMLLGKLTSFYAGCGLAGKACRQHCSVDKHSLIQRGGGPRPGLRVSERQRQK